MKRLTESRLLSGYIYGDPHTAEYVYLPGSEVDTDNPLAVYENGSSREDVSMEKALFLIEHRSLRPACHPILGDRSL